MTPEYTDEQRALGMVRIRLTPAQRRALEPIVAEAGAWQAENPEPWTTGATYMIVAQVRIDTPRARAEGREWTASVLFFSDQEHVDAVVGACTAAAKAKRGHTAEATP